MDVSMFVSLAKLAQRVIAVERLVAELRRIINDLGEQQFNNALVALDDALISSDPRHELTNAINHLQDAVSLSQQAYWKTGHSGWKKLKGPGVNHPNHPRYEVGTRICSALAIITTIYAYMGERKLALKYAEELRNEAGKAYPSNFHVSRKIDCTPDYMREGIREFLARNPPPAEAVRQRPSLDPNRDLRYWFGSGYEVDRLEEVFSFFDSVDLFLKQVGARPCNPKLQVRVHEYPGYILGYIPNAREREKAPPSRDWEFRVSSRRDFLAQFQKAHQAG